MGRVASSVGNGLMESFWSTMQRELLDRRFWSTRAELGSAIFESFEAFYNPRAVTPVSDISALSSTKPFTPRRLLRHDRVTHLSGKPGHAPGHRCVFGQVVMTVVRWSRRGTWRLPSMVVRVWSKVRATAPSTVA
jgi:hypothetical protein